MVARTSPAPAPAAPQLRRAGPGRTGAARGALAARATVAFLTACRAQAPVRLAQLLLLALSVGGALAFALQMAAWPDHPLADMTHLVWWTRIIRRDGVEGAYAGVYPETYVIYPPGMAYAFQAAAWISERVAPPPWILPWAAAGGDQWLRYCIKLVAVAGHGALALAIFAIVALGARAFWRAWTAATLYAWNPGALFDTAYWGQADSLHSLALVLAAAMLALVPGWWPLRAGGRWRLSAQAGALAAGAVAGALLAAGGLTKPQAWVFLPLLGWLLARRTGPLGLLAGAGAAAGVAWWIVQPWLRAGKLDELLSVFRNLQDVMPSVSANGHNLWWLKLPGVAIAVLDWEPLGGIGEWQAPPLLTHATAGRLAFGLFALLPLLRLTGPISLPLVLAAGGYTAVAYFMTITQVHENHLFAAIPFLAAAAALDPWYAIPFGVATLCFLGNLALHDFLISPWVAAQLGQLLPWREPLALQTANAALNVVGFAALTLLFLRRPRGMAQSAGALRWRARLVLLAGVALAGSALGAMLAVLREPAVAGRLWQVFADGARHIPPVEAHLGRRTPAEQLLVRAAADYANLLYLLAGAAAIVATLAALAGAWWLLCARAARYHSARWSVPSAEDQP
jgi:hypothetical protein